MPKENERLNQAIDYLEGESPYADKWVKEKKLTQKINEVLEAYKDKQNKEAFIAAVFELKRYFDERMQRLSNKSSPDAFEIMVVAYQKILGSLTQESKELVRLLSVLPSIKAEDENVLMSYLLPYTASFGDLRQKTELNVDSKRLQNAMSYLESENPRADKREKKEEKLTQRINDVLEAFKDKNNIAAFITAVFELKRYFDERMQLLSKPSAEVFGVMGIAYQEILSSLTNQESKELVELLTILPSIKANDKKALWSYLIPSTTSFGVDIFQKNSDPQTLLIVHLTHTQPIKTVLPTLEKLFPDEKEFNTVKQKLYIYEIQHADEILEAQKKRIKIFPTSHKGFLERFHPDLAKQAYGQGQERPGVEEAYQKNRPELLETRQTMFPHEYQKDEDVDKAAIDTVKEFLMHIQEVILGTKWKTGLSGVKIDFPKKNTVSPNMKLMLDEIRKAEKAAAKKPEIWLDAFKEVSKIGAKAAVNEPKFLGIKLRDKNVQKFFDQFKPLPANEPAQQNQRSQKRKK